MVTLHFTLTRWELLVLVLGEGWPFALGISLLLALVAVVLRGRRRRILWICAAILPVVYAVAALGVLGEMAVAKWKEDRMRRAHEPIRTPRELKGATLPVGTRIDWVSAAEKDFYSVDLPGVSQVLGVPLTGRMEFREPDGMGESSEKAWQGTLAANTTIDGWACAAGKVALKRGGGLAACTLVGARTFDGHAVPAGSELEARQDGFYVVVAAAMAMPELSSVMPAGSEVTFDREGCVEQAVVREETPMKVHGVRLWSDALRLHYDASARGGAGGPCGPVERVRGYTHDPVPGEYSTIGSLQVDLDMRTRALRVVRVGDPD